MAYAFNDDKSKAEVFTKEEIFNVIYPVGSIYMSANNVNPETLFGGTWQKIEGRFMLASGSGYNLGGTGGNANATLPSHTHNVSGSVANNGNHTHTFSGNTGNAGWHHHKNLPRDSEDYGPDFAYNCATMQYWIGTNTGRRQIATGSSGYYAWTGKYDDLWQSDRTTSAGNHNHSFSGTTSQNGNHNHSFNVTSGSAGSSATGANMPPYLVVNVWKRTA